jgi:hypothetical protein
MNPSIDPFQNSPWPPHSGLALEIKLVFLQKEPKGAGARSFWKGCIKSRHSHSGPASKIPSAV